MALRILINGAKGRMGHAVADAAKDMGVTVGAAVDVGFLDELVVELHDPEVDVDLVPFERDHFRVADLVPLVVELDELDGRFDVARLVVRLFIDHPQPRDAVVHLEQASRGLEPLDLDVQRVDLRLLGGQVGLRPDEQVVKPNADPMPAAGAMYARWTAAVQDNSSAATGASAFDFQGDGVAEVIQQDECFARVYDGATGAVQLQIMNSSATIHEYPLVADVDGDGNSEFVVVANFADPQNITDCQAATPGWTARDGLNAFTVRATRGDRLDWVTIRFCWNDHTTRSFGAPLGTVVQYIRDMESLIEAAERDGAAA